jgi:hypothetical protein
VTKFQQKRRFIDLLLPSGCIGSTSRKPPKAFRHSAELDRKGESDITTSVRDRKTRNEQVGGKR